MCLLVVVTRSNPEFPLVVGANRDEFLERPAVPMTVLREADPRILGGQDLQAGGTWLAVNEAGLVAGLTNQPSSAGKDPTKRSRGELPMALASHRTAAEAVEAFAAAFHPTDYNRAWLLVADREAAFHVDMTGEGRPVVEPLPPGVHILENRPWGAASAKIDRVRELVGDVDGLPGEALVNRVRSVLADHEIPDEFLAVADLGAPAPPPQVRAACVHADGYGTRWSGLITVPADAAALPSFCYADGPPCTTDYVTSPPMAPIASK